MIELYDEDGKPRKLQEIRRDLVKVLGDMVDEYFCVSFIRREYEVWPSNDRPGRLACYAVTGNSEGHYVHVDFVMQDFEKCVVDQLFVGKTFRGLAHAQLIAGICGKELGA